MDTTSIVLAVVTAVAVIAAVGFFLRNRRHASAVSDALRRIGGPITRSRHRVADLGEALELLERSTASAQRERARLAGALQAAPVGIVLTDDDGILVSSNPAAERYLGARQGQAVGEKRVREGIEQAILTRAAVEREIELHVPVRTTLHLTAIPLDFGVESAGCVVFLADVTEEQRVAAMRRDFVANVGHELKTPLDALAAIAGALADGIEDDPPSARLAERLRVESARLARQAGEILDLAQAEAMTAPGDPVSVGEVVDGAVGDWEEAAADAGVTIEVTPIDPALRVGGDARQLHTLISKLVENGIEYSTRRGDDSAPKVVVRAVATDDQVLIDIADDGIGISDVHLEHIFERFYRVDRERSRETPGAGLGLSVARHIARNHGGDVTVESVEGEGSTFTVTLPRWDAGS